MRHETLDLDGAVHLVEFGESAAAEAPSGAPIVLLHGLSGTYRDWLLVGEALATRLGRRHPVIAVDLLGFGDTPLHRHSTIEANAQLVARVVERRFREPAIWIGNSMGGLIAIAGAANFPEHVRATVLVDPSAPLPSLRAVEREIFWTFALTALPGVGDFLAPRVSARLTPEQIVQDTVARCCVDPTLLPDSLIQEAISFTRRRRQEHPWAARAHVGATRSIVSLILQPGKYRKMVDRIRAPTLVVHGQEDRLVPIASARALIARRPDWTLAELAGVGHIPHLEVPERFLAEVERWFAAKLQT